MVHTDRIPQGRAHTGQGTHLAGMNTNIMYSALKHTTISRRRSVVRPGVHGPTYTHTHEHTQTHTHTQTAAQVGEQSRGEVPDPHSQFRTW